MTVRATGGSLPCGGNLLAPLTGNKEGSKGLTAYTNSVPDQQSLYPDGQHTLAFDIKCVPPVGQLSLLFRLSAKSPIAQEERLATSPYLVTRFHLPHAVVGRLPAH